MQREQRGVVGVRIKLKKEKGERGGLNAIILGWDYQRFFYGILLGFSPGWGVRRGWYIIIF